MTILHISQTTLLDNLTESLNDIGQPLFRYSFTRVFNSRDKKVLIAISTAINNLFLANSFSLLQFHFDGDMTAFFVIFNCILNQIK